MRRARAARPSPARRGRAPRSAARGHRPRSFWSARLASFSVMTVWTSRCCAPSCRSRTTRRRSSSVAATIRARATRADLRPRFGVRDRRRDQLGEASIQARLGVRPAAASASGEVRPSTPQRRPSTTIGRRPRSGFPACARSRRSRRWPRVRRCAPAARLSAHCRRCSFRPGADGSRPGRRCRARPTPRPR